MADVRFGRGFVQSATNPAYTQGLFNLGQQIGSYDRRQKEKAAKVAVSKGMMGSVLAATNAIATGDMDAINEADQSLNELYEGVTDPALIQQINDARITVAQAGVEARPQYITNQANSLNKLKGSMRELDSQLEGLTGEDPAFEGLMRKKAQLKIKIDGLSKDAKVVTEANDIAYQTEFQATKRAVELGEQRSLLFQQQLAKAVPGSEAYEKIAQKAKDAGAGAAIEADKVRRAEAEAIQLERDELLLNKKRRTWGDGEIEAAMERTGMSEAELRTIGPVAYRQTRLVSLKKQEAALGDVMANRIKPSIIDAKALVRATLQHVRKTGEFENLPLGFLSRDIEDRIEGLSVEDYEEIDSLMSGETSPAEIQQRVMDWLTDKFPSEMQEYREENSITSQVDMQTAALYQSLRDNKENSGITDAELMSYAKDLMSGKITVE
jgi:hypothetical protein